MPTLYDFTADLIDSHPFPLETLRGSVVLIVNTASRCGFTPQYAALEALYRDLRPHGLEILAFPCNQFGAQESGSSEEISAFCDRTYGVTFPLFAKIEVNGPNAHPLYRWLKREKPGLLGIGRIPWNFTKFLIDRNGHAISRHSPRITPPALRPAIEALLGNEFSS